MCAGALKRPGAFCRAKLRPAGVHGRLDAQVRTAASGLRKECLMVREGSAPNFCPPTEEGITIVLEDERGDAVELEFLGLIEHDERSYGFFFPIDEDTPACSSGEVVVLEVLELDEDGQPCEFELVHDEAIALEVYEAFQTATRDLYDFE